MNSGIFAPLYLNAELFGKVPARGEVFLPRRWHTARGRSVNVNMTLVNKFGFFIYLLFIKSKTFGCSGVKKQNSARAGNRTVDVIDKICSSYHCAVVLVCEGHRKFQGI